MEGMKLTTGMIRRFIEAGDIQEVSRIPKETLEAFAENERQRDLWMDDGIRNIYAAMCYRAVEDYKNLAHKKKRTDEEQHCLDSALKFFDHPLFRRITGTSGREQAIRKIEATMLEEKKRKLMALMA